MSELQSSLPRRLGLVFQATAVFLAAIAPFSSALAQTTAETPAAHATNLLAARAGFSTHLTRLSSPSLQLPEPPTQLLRSIHYPSPVGPLAAYLTPDPADGGQHPAIIWLTGELHNSLDEVAWVKRPDYCDVSGRAFREAGLVMLYPSLRGGNNNPGHLEGCFGEVNDVLAASDYLASVKYVEPRRIYLAGHSLGGTLALLVAETTNRFRAIFAFGPVARIQQYGARNLPFDLNDPVECRLRSPLDWLDAVTRPTFVFEGDQVPNNHSSLLTLAQATHNPAVHCLTVPNQDHYSLLTPMCRLLANKLVHDDTNEFKMEFTAAEMRAANRVHLVPSE